MIRRTLFALTVMGATRLVAQRASEGKLESHTMFDSTYHRSRQVWVYTPPGYDAKATTPYPLIVAFDGDEYRDTMPLPMVLDTLLTAKKTPAFVAVLIENGEGAVRTATRQPFWTHGISCFARKSAIRWAFPRSAIPTRNA